LEQRTHKGRLQFSNDYKKFHGLLQNHPHYREEWRQGMNILQKNKRRQEIDSEMNDIKHKEEEEEDRQQRIATEWGVR
tara:strand:+ start:317 stop:550 length:234 start_codon:yes stop_codon:yes gene_type:complete